MTNKPPLPARNKSDAPVDDPILRRYSETVGVTQDLERDIIEFLSSKYTANATLSVEEVAGLYKCPPDRARRVIANLFKDELLVAVGHNIYKVNI